MTTSGGVQCWGDNFTADFGNGGPPASQTRLAQVTGLTSGVTAVSAGANDACALTSGGALWCWGAVGQDDGGLSFVPVQIPGITDNVTSVSVGDNYACAVVAGGVDCWADSEFGPAPAPMAVAGLPSGVFTAVSVSRSRRCMRRSESTAFS